MHTCPFCGSACRCCGDGEDHDTGPLYTADCEHCDPDDDDQEDEDVPGPAEPHDTHLEPA